MLRFVAGAPACGSHYYRTILTPEKSIAELVICRHPSRACSSLAATAAAAKPSLSSISSTCRPLASRSFHLRPRQQARLMHALSRRLGTSRNNDLLSSYNNKHTPFRIASRPFSSSSSTSSSSSSSSPQPSKGPKQVYAERVAKGLLKEDPRQLIILEDLQKTYDDIMSYKPPPVPEPLQETTSSENSSYQADGHTILANLEDNTPTFWGAFFGKKKNNSRQPPPIPPIPDDVPKSLYMFGDVGCGKSMLMDLLYECLPQSVGKRRVHFHAFMIDVHKRLHRISSNAESTGISKKGDAIVPVARELAKEGRVLCFDEFQVTDIADAMILRRLMESMLGYGFIIIITSNRAPKDLYKNGIQRGSFLPCISLIQSHFNVKDLDSEIDYRKIPRALSKVYYDPITPENRLEFNKLFEGFTDGQKIVKDDTLEVWGRRLIVPTSTGVRKNGGSDSSASAGQGKETTKVGDSVAMFTFEELCGDPLSAADYLEIVKNFDAVFITDLPRLTLSEKDKARRFITFIDAAYDSKTKLLTLSQDPITQIFSDKSAVETKNPDEGYTPHQRAMMDDLGLDAGTIGASSIFTGDEEIFAFARAVSRLAEMGTRQWADRVKGA